MKVKSSIKKVGAVAGSALMVGLTMGSAATLADYPQPFVDGDGAVNSQIVVGSNGKVADVVGAVNLAASVGQAAVQTTTQTVPGASSSEVDGETYDVAVRGANAPVEWLDASDYSELQRDSVEDSSGDTHQVIEQIGVRDTTVQPTVNGTDVLGSVGENAVQYTISYTPGFTVGDSIPVLGDNYEVTAITQDADANAQLELGSKQVEENLELDDSYGHGPYSVTVVDKDESGDGQIYLSVEKDGEALTSFGLKTGDSKTVDNGAFEITADEVFFGSRSDYIDVTSVYTDTTVTAGEDAPFDSDYNVLSLSGNFSDNTPDAGTVEGLTLQNKRSTVANPADTDNENDFQYLSAGDALAGPADYFSLTYQGLTEESTEEVQVKQGHVVSYTDFKGFSQSVDLTNGFLPADTDEDNDGTSGNTVGYNVPDSSGDIRYLDVAGRPVKVSVTNVDGNGHADTVKLSYQTWSATVDSTGLTGTTETGYGFSIDATMASDADDGGYDLELTSVSATDAPDGETPSLTSARLGAGDDDLDTQNEVEVNWDGTSVVSVNEDRFVDGVADAADDVYVSFADGTDDAAVSAVDDDSTTGSDASGDATGPNNWRISSDNSAERTTFGTTVETGADMTPVTLTVPEAALNAQFALGSVESTSGSDQTYEAYAGAQALPDMARLDSEVSESVRSNNHLVLVGGPAVNTLVSTLVDEGAVDLSEVADAESGAVLQVVNDAFASGQHALVVAGYGADDTRSAAQYLSNYADHESALSDAGDRLVLTEADYPSSQ